MGVKFVQKKESLRMKFLAVAFLIGAASSFKISSKLDLIKRFGESNVSFDPSLRTNYCNQCMEITVSSTGGTQEHQPNRLGRYTVAGSLWDNMIPFWMSDNRQYITPDPNSNPMFYYINKCFDQGLPFLDHGSELVGGQVHSIKVCQAVLSLNIFTDELEFSEASFSVSFGLQICQRYLIYATLQTI